MLVYGMLVGNPTCVFDSTICQSMYLLQCYLTQTSQCKAQYRSRWYLSNQTIVYAIGMQIELLARRQYTSPSH